MQRIFIVFDRFEIAGKGLALTGITDDDSLSIRDGSKVTIKRLGVDDIETFALGFERLQNTWSPHKPRNMVLLLVPEGVGLENVLPESEIWCEV